MRMQCRMCGGQLENCPTCDRDGLAALLLQRPCVACGNTGLVCPDHGARWSDPGHSGATCRDQAESETER